MIKNGNPRIKNIAVLTAGFAVLLVLSYGYPVIGDDWYFTKEYQVYPFLKAFKHGWLVMRSHAIGINGRYLGNYLVALFGCSEIARQIVRCAIMLVIVVCICRLHRCKSFAAYCAAFVLTIAVPTALYAQTYAWSAGFFNYVPPALLVLLYFPMLSDTQRGRPRQAILPFLLGVCSQLFSENVTVGLLLYCSVLFAVHTKRHGFSYKLFGHLLGLVVGCVAMFLAPGYRRIGSDADTYRDVAVGIGAIVEMVGVNASQIATYLFAENWGVLTLMTASCVILLDPFSAKLSKRKVILLCCLLIPCVYFVIDAAVLAELYKESTTQVIASALTCFMTVIYLVGLCGAILTIGSKEIREKLLLYLGGALAFSAPLLIVSPVSIRCVYLPYILLVCMALLLLRAAMQRIPRGRPFLRVSAIGLCACAMLCLAWISMWNGKTEQLRISYTQTLMQEGATQITLPDYPYQDHVWGAGSSGINYYYYYETPGDIFFRLTSYEQWDWDYFYSVDMKSVEEEHK